MAKFLLKWLSEQKVASTPLSRLRSCGATPSWRPGVGGERSESCGKFLTSSKQEHFQFKCH